MIDPQTYVDVSDAVFTIQGPIVDKYFGGSYDGHSVNNNVAVSLALTSPNGGEQFYPGSQSNITWTSTNVTNVSLEYSTNQGSSWVLISGSEPAGPGFYTWTVPNTPSQQAWVRIGDASNPILRDTSNAVFAIPSETVLKYAGGGFDGHVVDINASRNLMLLSPNGGESLADGGLFSINWVANSVNNVTIEFSSNNGIMNQS